MEENYSRGLSFWQTLQSWQDKLNQYKARRWLFFTVSLLFYTMRVLTKGGFHVVSYCLAILLLNQFLLFITPLKADVEDESTDTPVLPVNTPGEFKPFIRKLHEFKLWRNCMIGVLISVVCTWIDKFNIPVFWPVLVLYFIVLFIVTMKRQIAHMLKHGYVPFNFGKEQYSKS